MFYKNTYKFIFILCLVILTYLLLMEMAPAKEVSLYKDKLQHIVAFCGVTFWGLLAFRRCSKTIMLGLAILGALMEILQGVLTTTRQPSVYDWLADVVGILLTWVMLLVWQRWWNKRRG
jgi:VanZ family protein